MRFCSEKRLDLAFGSLHPPNYKGLDSHEGLRREHISKRVGMYNVQTYDEIYPYMQEGCMLDLADIPESYTKYFQLTRIMK